VAVLAAQVAMFALAAGSGGSYTALALPATAARQLLVPAVVALFFAWIADRSAGALVTLAVATGALALVHPTYALFVLLPLGGFVVARALLARRELVEGLAGLAAVVVPAGAVALWLRPIARETASVDPSGEELQRAIRHYKGQLDVFSDARYHLAPELFSRGGAVAVGALLAIPLAALAARARWAAYVIGGSLAVFALTLVPFVFPRFADAVSISQARRAAGFVPFAFAVAGASAVLARLLWLAALPVGLCAGIALQLAYPGDFGYKLEQGGPAIVTWIALIGAAAGLLAGIFLPARLARLDRVGAIAAATAVLAILPTALHGFTHWDEKPVTGPQLTRGLINALRTKVPERAVVFSHDDVSYAIAAYAPVYIAAAPPGHVADTKANRPYRRREDVRQFFETGNLAIPRRYGATWLVVKRPRSKLRLDLPRVYADAQYVLYRLDDRTPSPALAKVPLS
jgi:hypothetical protein